MNTAANKQEGTPATCFIPMLHGIFSYSRTFIITQTGSYYKQKIHFNLGLDDADICPTLKNFNFTNWDPDDEDDLGAENSQGPTKRKQDDFLPILPTSDDHAFDMDAVPDLGGGDFSDNETHLGGMEDIDEEEGGIDRHGRANGHDQQLAPILAMNRNDLGIVELKDHLSSQPQEYSYFGATARTAWAGPLHWRFKQTARRNKNVS